MTQDEVLQKLRGLLEQDFKVPTAKVTLDATFRGTLGMDSLDAVDLIYLVGKEFGVKTSVESFKDLHSVRQVTDHIVKIKGAA